MSRLTEKTKSFTAQSQSGENYTIHEYTTFEIAQYSNGQEDKVQVKKILKTSSGDKVNIIGKGEYKILDYWGTKVTSTDENAP